MAPNARNVIRERFKALQEKYRATHAPVDGAIQATDPPVAMPYLQDRTVSLATF